MVIARKANGEYKYILNCDRELPPKQQTVFCYRSLSLEEQYNSFGDEVSYERTGEGELRANIKLNKDGEIKNLVSCITKIENLKDPDGNDIIWPEDEVGRKKVLGQLQGEWRAELAEAIRSGGNLTADEVKN